MHRKQEVGEESTSWLVGVAILPFMVEAASSKNSRTSQVVEGPINVASGGKVAKEKTHKRGNSQVGKSKKIAS